MVFQGETTKSSASRQEKDAIPGDLPNFGRLGFPTFYSKAVPWPRLESEDGCDRFVRIPKI